MKKMSLTVFLMILSLSFNVAAEKFAVDNSLGARYAKEYRLYHNAYLEAQKALEGTGRWLPEFIPMERNSRKITEREIAQMRDLSQSLGKIAFSVRQSRHDDSLRRNQIESDRLKHGASSTWLKSGVSRNFLRGFAVLGAVAAAVETSSEVTAQTIQEKDSALEIRSQVRLHSKTSVGRSVLEKTRVSDVSAQNGTQ